MPDLRNEMGSLFHAGVETLASVEGENDYAAKIRWRYDRPYGGFDCTGGGNNNCL